MSYPVDRGAGQESGHPPAAVQAVVGVAHAALRLLVKRIAAASGGGAAAGSQSGRTAGKAPETGQQQELQHRAQTRRPRSASIVWQERQRDISAILPPCDAVLALERAAMLGLGGQELPSEVRLPPYAGRAGAWALARPSQDVPGAGCCACCIRAVTQRYASHG